MRLLIGATEEPQGRPSRGKTEGIGVRRTRSSGWPGVVPEGRTTALLHVFVQRENEFDRAYPRREARLRIGGDHGRPKGMWMSTYQKRWDEYVDADMALEDELWASARRRRLCQAVGLVSITGVIETSTIIGEYARRYPGVANFRNDDDYSSPSRASPRRDALNREAAQLLPILFALGRFRARGEFTGGPQDFHPSVCADDASASLS